MGQLQDAKIYTTKLSRRDRRANIITEIKAKSALNDLKGVWKTIKKASNLPTKVSNTNNNLDAEECNKYFAQIGPSIWPSRRRYNLLKCI